MPKSIQSVLAKMRSDPRVVTHKPAPAARIRAAERTLGVRFPDSYRDFLRTFGWATFGADEVYGLGTRTPRRVNLVRLALWERTSWQKLLPTLADRFDPVPEFPDGYIAIMGDGCGGCYCLDTTRMKGGECPVILWDHELLEAGRVAASFASWLERRLPKPEPRDLAHRASHPASTWRGLGKFATKGRPASEAEIAAAEKRLGVALPERYKEFARRYNGIEFVDNQFFGVGPKPGAGASLVAHAQKYWKQAKHPLPRTHVPIMRGVLDDIFCLDLSRLKGEDCPVVHWDPLAIEPELVDVAPTFVSWLRCVARDYHGGG